MWSAGLVKYWCVGAEGEVGNSLWIYRGGNGSSDPWELPCPSFPEPWPSTTPDQQQHQKFSPVQLRGNQDLAEGLIWFLSNFGAGRGRRPDGILPNYHCWLSWAQPRLSCAQMINLDYLGLQPDCLALGIALLRALMCHFSFSPTNSCTILFKI